MCPALRVKRTRERKAESLSKQSVQSVSSVTVRVPSAGEERMGRKNSMLEDCLPRLREAERVSKMCIDGVQNVKNRTELRMLSVNVSPNRLP